MKTDLDDDAGRLEELGLKLPFQINLLHLVNFAAQKTQRHVNPRRVKCSRCPYRTRFNYDLQAHEVRAWNTRKYQVQTF